MKVVKAEEVVLDEQPTQPQENEAKAAQVDQAKIAEIQEKFDAMRQVLETKKYGVALNAEQTTFLFEDFYQNVDWKGYESYAISETYDRLKEVVGEDGSLNGKISVEIIEAVFHFLKNYVGKGVEKARPFKETCDQFAVPMKEINEDRQNLRDLSLELVAAEQGIEVETLVDQLNKQQALQNGR